MTLRQRVDSLAQWLKHWISTPAVRDVGFFQTMHHVLFTNFHIRKSLVTHGVQMLGKIPTKCMQYPDTTIIVDWDVKQQMNKNSAEVDIAPASGKITKNVKYRSKAPGKGVF